MKVKFYTLILGFILSLFAVSAVSAQSSTSEEPKALKVIEPSLPYEVARYKISSEAMVRFKLDSNGRPVGIRVESSSDRDFAESVVRAVRQWRYEVPEGYNGQEFRLPVVVNFDA
ncbi:MAG: energy transducer TonB [Verrucomicrobiota bacterium JB022]|nr:energy transducer TonB [Verrucomicrobiota bacterium JB022]